MALRHLPSCGVLPKKGCDLDGYFVGCFSGSCAHTEMIAFYVDKRGQLWTNMDNGAKLNAVPQTGTQGDMNDYLLHDQRRR